MPVYAATVAPVASIDAPLDTDVVNGSLDIYMTVVDDGNLDFYRIQVQDSLSNIVYDPGKVFVGAGDLSGFSNRLINTWDTTGLNGTYTLYYVAKDTDPQGTWLNFDFEVDNTAPAVPSLVSPADGIEMGSAVLILDWSDETDTNGPVTYNYQSSWNGGSYGPVSVGTTSQINGSGSAERTYEWQVQSCDSLDNCSAWSGPWTITVDDTTPTSTMDGTLDDTMWDSAIPVTGTTTDTNTVDLVSLYYRAASGAGDTDWSGAILIDTVATQPDDSWSYDWTPASGGAYDIKAAGTDAAGNIESSAYAYNVTFDITPPPTPSLTSPADGANLNSSAAYLNWSDETDTNGPVTYNIELKWGASGTSGIIDAGTTSLFDATLYADESYTWYVQACDALDNCSAWSTGWVVNIDDTAPIDPTIFTSDPLASTWTKDNTITVSWPAVDDTGGASDNVTGVDGYSYEFTTGATDIPDNVKDIEEGILEVTSDALTQDDWYFHIRTVDNTGNWTSTEHVGPFMLDLTKPAITLDTAPASDSIATDFSLEGTASDADSGIVFVKVQFVETGTSTVVQTCEAAYTPDDWSLDVNGAATCQVPDGIYDIFAVTKDNALNWKSTKAWDNVLKVGVPTVTNVTIDNTAPVVGDPFFNVSSLGFINGSIFTVYVEVSDVTSGIDATSCMISLDGGSSWTAAIYNGSTKCSATFIYSLLGGVDGELLDVEGKVSDLAGNTTIGDNVLTTTDASEPLNALLSMSHASATWSNDNTVGATWDAVNVGDGATDAKAGVKEYFYKFTNAFETKDDYDYLNWYTDDFDLFPQWFVDLSGYTMLDKAETTLDSGTLADGTWWLNMTTVDKVGEFEGENTYTNVAEFDNYGPFMIDTVKPVITMDNPVTDDILNFFTMTGGVADDASGISFVKVKFMYAGTDTLAVMCVADYDSGTDSWSLDVNDSATCQVPDGVYDVFALTRDEAKNWKNTKMWDGVLKKMVPSATDVIIDMTAPTDPVEFTYSPDINIPTQDNTIFVDWPEVDETEVPVVTGEKVTPSGVIVNYIGATDNLSRVAGYSYSFTTGATDLPNEVMDLAYDETKTTSIPLEDGSWYFHLRTVDNAGNWTSTQHVGPFVIDNAPPEITLAGEPIVNVLLGSIYADAGATALDSTDGDLTASVVAINSVDTAVEGLYTVTYNVTDSAGNAASEVTRAVNVIAPAPIAAVLGVDEADLPLEEETTTPDEGDDADDGSDDVNGEVKGEETTSDDSDTSSPTFDWWWAIYLLGGSMLVYIVWFWFFRKKDTY